MNNTQTTTAVPNQQGTQSPSIIGSFAPILIMILAFYFLMIRPQQKREAKKKDMLSKLRKGDKVVTASGIIGTVHKVVSDDEVSFEISGGIRIRILRSAITSVVDKNSSLGKDLVEEKPDSKELSKKSAKLKSKEKKSSK
ncbi:MAG: preprotein translocase subunit YajC [Alphaproteobacteria bacterium]|nr:preprotein translocase subunit YajC [Alphaproteobacteria bacterium]